MRVELPDSSEPPGQMSRHDATARVARGVARGVASQETHINSPPGVSVQAALPSTLPHSLPSANESLSDLMARHPLQGPPLGSHRLEESQANNAHTVFGIANATYPDFGSGHLALRSSARGNFEPSGPNNMIAATPGTHDRIFPIPNDPPVSFEPSLPNSTYEEVDSFEGSDSAMSLTTRDSDYTVQLDEAAQELYAWLKHERKISVLRDSHQPHWLVSVPEISDQEILDYCMDAVEGAAINSKQIKKIGLWMTNGIVPDFNSHVSSSDNEGLMNSSEPCRHNAETERETPTTPSGLRLTQNVMALEAAVASQSRHATLHQAAANYAVGLSHEEVNIPIPGCPSLVMMRSVLSRRQIPFRPTTRPWPRHCVNVDCCPFHILGSEAQTSCILDGCSPDLVATIFKLRHELDEWRKSAVPEDSASYTIQGPLYELSEIELVTYCRDITWLKPIRPERITRIETWVQNGALRVLRHWTLDGLQKKGAALKEEARKAQDAREELGSREKVTAKSEKEERGVCPHEIASSPTLRRIAEAMLDLPPGTADGLDGPAHASASTCPRAPCNSLHGKSAKSLYDKYGKPVRPGTLEGRPREKEVDPALVETSTQPNDSSTGLRFGENNSQNERERRVRFLDSSSPRKSHDGLGKNKSDQEAVSNNKKRLSEHSTHTYPAAHGPPRKSPEDDTNPEL